ncbi:hypothetical protein CRUP_000092 [Coryphaenoides rupestris]|nr:hypothetical protein CRUP_000092 [Coryphaenoides rupestris]
MTSVINKVRLFCCCCCCFQVSWNWRGIVELDQLWMPKCVRLGWTLSFSPTPHELSVWKRLYVETVRTLRTARPQVGGASELPDPQVGGASEPPDPLVGGAREPPDPRLEGARGPPDPRVGGASGQPDPQVGGSRGPPDPKVGGASGQPDPQVGGASGQPDPQMGGASEPHNPQVEGASEPHDPPQPFVVPEVTVLRASTPNLPDQALYDRVRLISTPPQRAGEEPPAAGRRRSNCAVEAGAGAGPGPGPGPGHQPGGGGAALPPWRHADRHPKDTHRFNYLQMRGSVDHVRKSLSAGTYKLRKAKSQMMLSSLDLDSRYRQRFPPSSPPPPPPPPPPPTPSIHPHLHPHQTRPDWAVPTFSSPSDPCVTMAAAQCWAGSASGTRGSARVPRGRRCPG